MNFQTQNNRNEHSIQLMHILLKTIWIELSHEYNEVLLYKGGKIYENFK